MKLANDINWIKTVSFMLALLLTLCLPATASADPDPHFKPLIQKLKNSGFDNDWIDGLFDEKCMTLNHKVLMLRLTIRESKINYAQFYEPENIEKCKNFIKNNEKALNDAHEKYSVPPEVVTGILLLETRLGEYTGKFNTLQTLATHSVAGDKEVVKEVYGMLEEKDKKRWTLETAAKRLGNRTSWSFGELKAFLKYLEKTGNETCKVFGSYTGAIGFCQFQPSNLKPYGVDGNGDGVTDLFQVEDAIHSAAHYLNRHGWKKGITQSNKIRVIKTYNNSTPYAKTILEVASRLGK